MTMAISNFYVMKLPDIPKQIIDEYSLFKKGALGGSIYIVANKGIYGPPQAEFLANELLKKYPNKRRYNQSNLVPGLWKYN